MHVSRPPHFRKLKRTLFLLIFCLVVWMVGLTFFVRQIPQTPQTSTEVVDAAIVLTGGSKRIHHGFVRVAEDLAGEVFISGVGDEVTPKDVVKQAREKTRPINNSQLTLGHEARSTIGNAAEVRAWVIQNDITSIRLITANYHMPRSMQEIRFALPESIILIPDPVFPDGFDISRWLSDTSSRKLVMSEYHKFLAGQLRHLLIKLNLQ